MQENVQIGCTGYVNIAGVWMMENNGCVYNGFRDVFKQLSETRPCVSFLWRESVSSSYLSRSKLFFD